MSRIKSTEKRLNRGEIVLNITNSITLHTSEMDEMKELMTEFSSEYSGKIHSVIRRMNDVIVGIDMTISDKISLTFHGMNEIKSLLDEMESYQEHTRNVIDRIEELRTKAEEKLNQPQEYSATGSENS